MAAQSKYNVAVVGATGLVGQQVLKILAERKFPVGELFPLASDRSAGKTIVWQKKQYEVKETTPQSFKGVDFVFMAASNAASKEFAPIAVKSGAVVIDKSSFFRMDPTVPLVVPEVNGADIKKHKGIIASPNCSTIPMVVALNPLHQVNPIKHIVVDTYQAVSGTGSAAVDELELQVQQIAAGKPTAPKVYPRQIALNVLPEVDSFLDNGYTKEEWKMVEETRKIMHAAKMQISATCVRVPVYVGHSEAVHVEFSRPISPEEVNTILREAPGVKVMDNPKTRLYPTALDADGKDEVFVGRIRQDASNPKGLVMWVVSDNIRKGAALNAIQIAEELVSRQLI